MIRFDRACFWGSILLNVRWFFFMFSTKFTRSNFCWSVICHQISLMQSDFFCRYCPENKTLTISFPTFLTMRNYLPLACFHCGLNMMSNSPGLYESHQKPSGKIRIISNNKPFIYELLVCTVRNKILSKAVVYIEIYQPPHFEYTSV